MGHLKAIHFMDVLEGRPLPQRWTSHLNTCERCRQKVASTAPFFQDAADALSPDAASNVEAVQPDWNEVRSSVRGELLARAVRRSSHGSTLTRWSSSMLSPPPAVWGAVAPLLVVASVLIIAELWHSRTADTPSVIAEIESPVGTDAVLSPFVDDAATLETEALAWSESEIFISLNELGEDEEDVLRELLALTFETDDGI